MILHGNNLIIMADGQVLGAAKSCSINVNSELLPVSSPTDGQWKHFLAGIKEWSIETSQLMSANSGVSDKIEAFATHHDGLSQNYQTMPPYIAVNGSRLSVQGLTVQRGITVVALAPATLSVVSYITVDTYTDITTASSTMAAFLLQNIGNIFVGYTYDAFGVSADMYAFLLHLGLPALPSYVKGQKGRWAYAFVTGPKSSSDGTYKGIATFANDTITARVSMNLTNGYPATATPLKTAASRVGTKFTLKCQVDGFAYDTLIGEAFCKTFRVNATEGNLMQGSFSWTGNGGFIELISSISLSPNTLSLHSWHDYNNPFTVNIQPANATNKTLVWSSSDESVAEVDSQGNITTHNAGSCTITASSTDGSDVTGSATLNVIAQ